MYTYNVSVIVVGRLSPRAAMGAPRREAEVRWHPEWTRQWWGRDRPQRAAWLAHIESFVGGDDGYLRLNCNFVAAGYCGFMATIRPRPPASHSASPAPSERRHLSRTMGMSRPDILLPSRTAALARWKHISLFFWQRDDNTNDSVHLSGRKYQESNRAAVQF